MNCAHCHNKILEGAVRHTVMLRNNATTSVVCGVCFEDNTIDMHEVNYCSRCEEPIREDRTSFHDGDGLVDDAPYIDDPLCPGCYDAIYDEYGIPDGPDEYPDEPQPAAPSGAEAPPDKDYQMDA